MAVHSHPIVDKNISVLEDKIKDIDTMHTEICQIVGNLTVVRQQIYAAVHAPAKKCNAPIGVSVKNNSQQCLYNTEKATSFLQEIKSMLKDCGQITCKYSPSTQISTKMKHLASYICQMEDIEIRSKVLTNLIPTLEELYRQVRYITRKIHDHDHHDHDHHDHHDHHYDDHHDHHDHHYDDHHDHHYDDHHDHHYYDHHYDDHHDYHDYYYGHDHHDSWEHVADKYGRLYWANPETGQTQWDDPHHHRRLGDIHYHVRNLLSLHNTMDSYNKPSINCVTRLLEEFQYFREMEDKIIMFGQKKNILSEIDRRIDKTTFLVKNVTQM